VIAYDVTSNQVIWGTGNPVPMFDPTYRPGDNLYTNSVISQTCSPRGLTVSVAVRVWVPWPPRARRPLRHTFCA
jgi:glucose dehydrogenase